MQLDEITAKVQSFVVENFLFRSDRDALSETESLIEANIIDSTGVLELVGFLESDFKISVGDGDIVPENLDTIRSIASYIQRKLPAETAS